jgi:hypothetical protein
MSPRTRPGFNSQGSAMTPPTIEQLQKALHLALRMLQPHEPASVAHTSDEFIALACVFSGDVSGNVMQVIDAALNKPEQ